MNLFSRFFFQNSLEQIDNYPKKTIQSSLINIEILYMHAYISQLIAFYFLESDKQWLNACLV